MANLESNYGTYNGNSELGATMYSAFGDLICLRRLFSLRALTTLIFSFRKRHFFLHTCVICSELPSNTESALLVCDCTSSRTGGRGLIVLLAIGTNSFRGRTIITSKMVTHSVLRTIVCTAKTRLIRFNPKNIGVKYSLIVWGGGGSI